jgi:hypothetical protein
LVQLIEFQTSDVPEVVDALRRLHQRARADGSQLTAEIRKDRDRKDRYVWVLTWADTLDGHPLSLERLSADLSPYIDGEIVVRNLEPIGDDSYVFGDDVSVRASRAR